jgi:hypothetical protein
MRSSRRAIGQQRHHRVAESGRIPRPDRIPDYGVVGGSGTPYINVSGPNHVLGGATGPPQRLGAALPRAPRLTGALKPLLDVLLNEPDRTVGAAETNRRDPPSLSGVLESSPRHLQPPGKFAWLEQIGHELTCLLLVARCVPTKVAQGPLHLTGYG